MLIEEMETIELELTWKCNLSCYMCPRNINPDLVGLPDKEMALEDVEKIFDTLPNLKHLNCTGLGEALTYSKISELLALCQKRDIQFCTTTNGTLLKGKILDELPEDSIIYVDVDSVDEEKYKKKKGGYSLNSLKENIDNLLSKTKVNLYTATLVMNDNLDELRNIIDYAVSINVKGMVFTYPRIHKAEDYERFSPFIDPYMITKVNTALAYGVYKNIPLSGRGMFFAAGCQEPQKQCSIGVDGRIYPCDYICMDKWNTKSYTEVLFGKEFVVPSNNFCMGNIFNKEGERYNYALLEDIRDRARRVGPWEHYGLMWQRKNLNWNEGVNYCLVCGHKWGYIA